MYTRASERGTSSNATKAPERRGGSRLRISLRLGKSGSGYERMSDASTLFAQLQDDVSVVRPPAIFRAGGVVCLALVVATSGLAIAMYLKGLATLLEAISFVTG